VVAEVEAVELGAERGGCPRRLAGAHLLDPLDRHPRLLPELAGLALLAIGQREHLRRPTRGGRDRDRAAGPPDEVGRVRSDDEQLRHAAPARRRDCPTISSCTSSSAKPAPSRWSAQSASPSSTGG